MTLLGNTLVVLELPSNDPQYALRIKKYINVTAHLHKVEKRMREIVLDLLAVISVLTFNLSDNM